MYFADRELNLVIEMALAAGWPVELGQDAVMIEQPDDAGLIVLKRPHAAGGGWWLLSKIVVPALVAADTADLASLLAEMLAGKCIWPLHRLAP